MLVRQLERLPFEHSFVLLGDLLVFVCLDGKTTVEEFERVLDHMRVLYASCIEEVSTARGVRVPETAVQSDWLRRNVGQLSELAG